MKLLGLLILVNLAWDQVNPELVTRWELWTWVNNGQVEQSVTDVLPTDEAPFSITKDATIGDEFYAKVRACDESQCSEWSEELVHVVTETQVITLEKPANIRIEIIVQ